ncbi:hypothetical protein DKX38_009294 [Salix brachista]|uniref:Uncharacterized protein n=1 Tax=Salix brachista TaxID=2182728 RepID=A0A5N5MCH3_9ROSI|nr:hypothetical protein DKX38_009294 [Salix brachista]
MCNQSSEPIGKSSGSLSEWPYSVSCTLIPAEPPPSKACLTFTPRFRNKRLGRNSPTEINNQDLLIQFSKDYHQNHLSDSNPCPNTGFPSSLVPNYLVSTLENELFSFQTKYLVSKHWLTPLFKFVYIGHQWSLTFDLSCHCKVICVPSSPTQMIYQRSFTIK